LFIDLNNQ